MSLQLVWFRTDSATGEPGPDVVPALKWEGAAENPLVGLPQDLISRVVGAPVPTEPSAVVGAYHS